jgi:NADPH:quinone reductase-like Zn-dependent oxidoreductase
MLKGVDLCGVHLGGFQEYEPDMYRKNLMQILKWASEEQISPYIYKRCSLNDASLHIASLKQRNTLGKIIVDMSR